MKIILILLKLFAIWIVATKQIQSESLNKYSPQFSIKLHRYGMFDISKLLNLKLACELQQTLEKEIKKENERKMKEVFQLRKKVNSFHKS